MRKMFMALTAAIVLGVCTVSPAVGDEVAVEGYDYIGNSTPIVVEAYPGILFYPRYVIECDCIMPIAFIGGVWINSYGGRVRYHGRWGRPSNRAFAMHREEFRRNPGMYRRMERPGTDIRREPLHVEQRRVEEQRPREVPQYRQVLPQRPPVQQQRAPERRACGGPNQPKCR